MPEWNHLIAQTFLQLAGVGGEHCRLQVFPAAGRIGPRESVTVTVITTWTKEVSHWTNPIPCSRVTAVSIVPAGVSPCCCQLPCAGYGAPPAALSPCLHLQTDSGIPPGGRGCRTGLWPGKPPGLPSHHLPHSHQHQCHPHLPLCTCEALPSCPHSPTPCRYCS